MEKLILFEHIAAYGPVGILALLGIMIVSLFTLCKGADWLVDGAANLAYKIGMPKIIVGATVISLGTTSPEVAVSVMGAIDGKTGLAIGNALGSVICDTGLIFGLACCLTALPLDKYILNRHGWLQFGAGFLFLGLALYAKFFGGNPPLITGVMGVGLLALLVGYLLISVKWAREHTAHGDTGDETDETIHATTIKICVLLIVTGLAIVIASAEVLVGAAEQICLYYKIPEAVIAATVIAFGTSLPELVTAMTSIKKGHTDLLVGNILGADILNILFVIGASAAASFLPGNPGFIGLPISNDIFVIQIPAMIFILVLFRVAVMTGKDNHFRRAWGYLLLAAYFIFIVVSYLYSS
jgi:cation:H+ antiporter